MKSKLQCARVGTTLTFRTASAWLLAACLLALAGCASTVKVQSGEQVIGERLVFNLEGPWNQVNLPGQGPAKVWTMEGLPIDQLLVYSGLKDGEAVGNVPSQGDAAAARKKLEFHAAMRPDEIVALFEGMLSRDGSTFALTKLEPVAFGGGKGFRFDYSLTRKVDSVQLSGMGFGVVDKGQLFAIVYLAPRLTFFPRHKPRVEQMAQSAHLKS
jgi:hypothetical protein